MTLSLAVAHVFRNVNKIKCTSIKEYWYSQHSLRFLCQSSVTHIQSIRAQSRRVSSTHSVTAAIFQENTGINPAVYITLKKNMFRMSALI